MKSPLEVLQPLGRALMLPIAVLPVAALLLRIGQPDLLGAPGLAAMTGGLSLHIASVFGAAGGAIFSSLGLIFAIGVAVGLARENHGAAGLAGVVCYVIATKGVDALMVVPPEIAAAAVESARGPHRRRLEGQGDRQAVDPGRHPVGRDQRLALQPLFPTSSCPSTWLSSADAASCRSSRVWPAWSWPCCLASSGAIWKPASTASAAWSSPRAMWACSSTACSTDC